MSSKIFQIDSDVLQQAELYARQRNINLNRLVEDFMRKFIRQSQNEKNDIKVTAFVESLGVDLNLPSDFDDKKAYQNYLGEKYK